MSLIDLSDILFNYCSQCLTSSCVVKKDLRLLQCGEAIPGSLNIECTHD
jgi:hypothetical protein